MIGISKQKQVLKELATQQLSTHGSRNFVMVISITLTALLLSFVFTAGLSFIFQAWGKNHRL